MPRGLPRGHIPRDLRAAIGKTTTQEACGFLATYFLCCCFSLQQLSSLCVYVLLAALKDFWSSYQACLFFMMPPDLKAARRLQILLRLFNAARWWRVLGVIPCVVMAAGGGPGVLGKGRAGTGPGPAETDYKQPGGKGQTQAHKLFPQ